MVKPLYLNGMADRVIKGDVLWIISMKRYLNIFYVPGMLE